jgi:hypothetical protein
MREEGLSEAIRAAGGVRALAQKIGISQPSVSNWTRVPADRVRAVEAATGISRAVLRPDLFAQIGEHEPDLDEVDAARAQEYTLLSVLLARAPDAALLKRLATLRGDASPLGIAHVALAEPPASRPSSASSSTSSSGSGAASCFRTDRTTSVDFCMSARSRDCGSFWLASVLSAVRAKRSPRNTPRSCVRSWRGS